MLLHVCINPDACHCGDGWTRLIKRSVLDAALFIRGVLLIKFEIRSVTVEPFVLLQLHRFNCLPKLDVCADMFTVLLPNDMTNCETVLK